MINHNSILLDTDAYKLSMYEQYPEGTEYVSSYIEARKNPWERVTFFGLQHLLVELATTVTEEDVLFAKDFWESQGLPFNLEGWMTIVNELDGKLPIRIDAVPEGTRLKHNNVLVQVVNTDPRFFWLTTWIETKLLRVWYPTTVATISSSIRDMIKEKLEITADDPEAELPFKLHDFGCRGVSSAESASIGGCAHIVNFMGTDTGPALAHAMNYYKAPIAGTACSIPASEHSTITSWGKENEVKAFENMLNKFGGGMLVACVSDSYDIYNATDVLWGKELKDKVVEMDAMLVVRPDSGDPVEMPVEVVKRLDAAFGHEVNSKGYKVLNHVRVIQGDGINYDSVKAILDRLVEEGYSISNIAFGMGGALLQHCDRDTLSFAMKCSAICIDGEWKDVYKEAPGKESKRGRLALIHTEERGIETIRQDEVTNDTPVILQNVFANGEITIQIDWEDIVKRARG